MLSHKHMHISHTTCTHSHHIYTPPTPAASWSTLTTHFLERQMDRECRHVIFKEWHLQNFVSTCRQVVVLPLNSLYLTQKRCILGQPRRNERFNTFLSRKGNNNSERWGSRRSLHTNNEERLFPSLFSLPLTVIFLECPLSTEDVE